MRHYGVRICNHAVQGRHVQIFKVPEVVPVKKERVGGGVAARRTHFVKCVRDLISTSSPGALPSGRRPPFRVHYLA